MRPFAAPSCTIRPGIALLRLAAALSARAVLMTLFYHTRANETPPDEKPVVLSSDESGARS